MRKRHNCENIAATVATGKQKICKGLIILTDIDIPNLRQKSYFCFLSTELGITLLLEAEQA